MSEDTNEVVKTATIVHWIRCTVMNIEVNIMINKIYTQEEFEKACAVSYKQGRDDGYTEGSEDADENLYDAGFEEGYEQCRTDVEAEVDNE